MKFGSKNFYGNETEKYSEVPWGEELFEFGEWEKGMVEIEVDFGRCMIGFWDWGGFRWISREV
jgi:hypothetical protein